MDNKTTKEEKLLAEEFEFRIWWLWILGSGVSALVGTGLALSVFPNAAFLSNPTGVIGLHLVGFALAIGIPVSLTQWQILRYISRRVEIMTTSFISLWIPVTSIGIVIMMMPLWYWQYHSEEFLWLLFIPFVPLLIIVSMIPGIFILGLGQWLLIRKIIVARFNWVVRTIIGATIGIVFGAFAGFLTLNYPITFDVMWATLTMVIMAAFQAPALVRYLNANHKL